VGEDPRWQWSASKLVGFVRERDQSFGYWTEMNRELPKKKEEHLPEGESA